VTLPYTAPADRVLQLAQEEAERFSHEYVGTEHLLLAAVREDACDAAAVLRGLGIAADDIRGQIGRILQYGPPGERVVFGRLIYTPRAQSVLALAATAARELRDDAVGPEHLLVGLMDEAEGVAAQVLLNLGTDSEAVRDGVLRLRPLPGAWRTEAAVALARGIAAERAFDRLPVLADALEDAGCLDAKVLDHLRRGSAHGCRAPRCWVSDRVLVTDRPPGGGRPDQEAPGAPPERPRTWWRFWG